MARSHAVCSFEVGLSQIRSVAQAKYRDQPTPFKDVLALLKEHRQRTHPQARGTHLAHGSGRLVGHDIAIKAEPIWDHLTNLAMRPSADLLVASRRASDL
jgi:hypothetical protein